MRSTVMLGLGTCVVGLLAGFLPSYRHPASIEYSRETITQLIDDLTQIDSESPGISTSAIYVGFVQRTSLLLLGSALVESLLLKCHHK